MTARKPHTERVYIDAALVGRLVAAQYPRWADLPIRPVELAGWDNTTFRLGEDMSVRLPSAVAYAPQVEKEHRWLPRLAPLLPPPIPVPLAKGQPGEGYPFHWSVYRWLDGETAMTGRIDDVGEFAEALAEFLTALRRIDPAGGPLPGRHNFFRGGPLRVYDAETRQAIVALEGRIDVFAAAAVWEAALAATWHGPPVWFHGDIAAGNLLVEGGRLSAVIDFGTSGGGRPFLRPGYRVDLLPGRGAGRVPRRTSPGRRDLEAGPRLGAVEGPDHAGRTHRRRPSRSSKGSARDRRHSRRPPARRMTRLADPGRPPAVMPCSLVAVAVLGEKTETRPFG